MKKRSWTLVAASGALALLFSGAAQAADVPPFQEVKAGGADECRDGRYCLYNETSYNDDAAAGIAWMWQAKSTQPDLHRAPGAGDEPESVVNNTGVPITLYEHYHSGRCLTVPAGGMVDDLDDYGMRNMVSSVHMGNTYRCPSWGTVAR